MKASSLQRSTLTKHSMTKQWNKLAKDPRVDMFAYKEGGIWNKGKFSQVDAEGDADAWDTWTRDDQDIVDQARATRKKAWGTTDINDAIWNARVEYEEGNMSEEEFKAKEKEIIEKYSGDDDGNTTYFATDPSQDDSAVGDDIIITYSFVEDSSSKFVEGAGSSGGPNRCVWPGSSDRKRQRNAAFVRTSWLERALRRAVCRSRWTDGSNRWRQCSGNGKRRRLCRSQIALHRSPVGPA